MMNENRNYGLEDGRADVTAGRPPQIDLTLAETDDYEQGYIDAYQRGLSEAAEQPGGDSTAVEDTV